MNKINKIKVFAWMAFIIVVFIIGYLTGGGRFHIEKVPEPIHSTLHKAEETAGVTVWTCSMHPQIRKPEPGKCPICGMELIPVKKDTGTDKTGPRELVLSEKARKLADIQTARVERKSVTAELKLFGKVTYDETRLGYITARFPGRLDKLYVDFTGEFVKKGQPMAEIYSPELLTAQQELIHSLQVVRDLQKSKVDIIRKSAEATVKAAREKLRLWDLTPEQIRELERKEEPDDHITLYALSEGIVIQKNALEGSYVNTGTVIYTVADLSYVWVEIDAYESDIEWLKIGQDVSFEVEAFPGKLFHGPITFIDPVVDKKTRVVKVRLEVNNPDIRLKPDMFVHATIKAALPGKEERPLVIPESAPLITGKRAVVYVEKPGREGVYGGREVVLGQKAAGYYEVLSGLKEGEKVVVHGNFKIDSAMQILAKPSMMNPEGGVPAPGHKHHGEVKSQKDEGKSQNVKGHQHE